VRHFVEDEEEIAEKDTVTLQVKFTRKNVPEGERAPPVHAPHLPFKKEEAYWVMLTEATQKQLIAVDKVTAQDREVTHELKFLAPPKKGVYSFRVYIVSDSYLGIDCEETFNMKVISAEELPAYEPHKEDLELDNEVSLFEGALGGANFDSDESSDEDDEPEPNAKAAAAASNPARSPSNPDDEGAGNLSEAQLKKRRKRIEQKEKQQRESRSPAPQSSASGEEDAPDTP